MGPKCSCKCHFKREAEGGRGRLPTEEKRPCEDGSRERVEDVMTLALVTEKWTMSHRMQL